MENVAKNVVVNEVVVNAVKENLDKKEENGMENTQTTTLTFELVRNSHDAIDVTFSEKPCREILNRLNEGYTKRSERFNWFNGVWSTFRFNKSKELDRVGKDDEMLECKMFIEKIINEPLTMTDEEAKAHRKEMIKENKASRNTAKAETKKSTKTTKKASTKKEAKKETKKADTKKSEKDALNEKVNAYLKSINMKREDFSQLPVEAKKLILAGMPE